MGLNQLGSNLPGSLNDSGSANPGNWFRYDPTLAGYIYNLSTKGLPSGTWSLSLSAMGDPASHSVLFNVK